MRSKKNANAFSTFLNFWTTKNNQNIALDNLYKRNYSIEYLSPHYESSDNLFDYFTKYLLAIETLEQGMKYVQS